MRRGTVARANVTATLWKARSCRRRRAREAIFVRALVDFLVSHADLADNTRGLDEDELKARSIWTVVRLCVSAGIQA